MVVIAYKVRECQGSKFILVSKSSKQVQQNPARMLKVLCDGRVFDDAV